MAGQHHRIDNSVLDYLERRAKTGSIAITVSAQRE
jgi:hypothetical protein